jgi:hypothetical protein
MQVEHPLKLLGFSTMLAAVVIADAACVADAYNGGRAFLGDKRLKPAPGIRRPPSSLHPPFVHLVVATVVRSESGLRTR